LDDEIIRLGKENSAYVEAEEKFMQFCREKNLPHIEIWQRLEILRAAHYWRPIRNLAIEKKDLKDGVFEVGSFCVLLVIRQKYCRQFCVAIVFSV
jgi:hypothetical protein